MAQIRNSGSHGLQQLIDSYNEEIMRYSRLASPGQHGNAPDTAQEPYSQSAGKDSAERQREESEFEAERGLTEQNYLLGKGKYGIIRRGDDENSFVPPDNGNTDGEHHAKTVSEHAERFIGLEDSVQQQGLADLEQGLRELKRGLEELAKGQRELREGLLAYLRGIAERDRQLDQNGQRMQCSAHEYENDDDGYGNWDYADGISVPSAGSLYDDSFHAPSGPVPSDIPDTPPAQSPYSVSSDGTGYGMFQASVYTARRSVPIPGALVTVFFDGKPYAAYPTDGDGKTPAIQLPAGTASSQDESYAAPFVNYRVTVTADGYYPQNDLTAQIFSGQTAFLPVEMVPLPDGV